MDFTNITFKELDIKLDIAKKKITESKKQLKNLFICKSKKNDLLQIILNQNKIIEDINKYISKNQDEYNSFKKEWKMYTSDINKKNDIKNNIRTLYSSTFDSIKYLIKLGIIDKKLNDKFLKIISNINIKPTGNDEMKTIFFITSENKFTPQVCSSYDDRPYISDYQTSVVDIFFKNVENGIAYSEIKKIISDELSINESRIKCSSYFEHILDKNCRLNISGRWGYDIVYNNICVKQDDDINNNTRFIQNKFCNNKNKPVVIFIRITHDCFVPEQNDIKFLYNKIKELEIKVQELSNNK